MGTHTHKVPSLRYKTSGVSNYLLDLGDMVSMLLLKLMNDSIVWPCKRLAGFEAFACIVL